MLKQSAKSSPSPHLTTQLSSLSAEFSQKSQLKSGAKQGPGQARRIKCMSRGQSACQIRGDQWGINWEVFCFSRFSLSQLTPCKSDRQRTISLSVKLSFQTKNYFPTRKMNEHSQQRLTTTTNQLTIQMKKINFILHLQLTL